MLREAESARNRSNVQQYKSGQMLSGPTHEATQCLPCCCLSATPFPDVLLLDHVSVNVNVFWFVKFALKGYTSRKILRRFLFQPFLDFYTVFEAHIWT